MIDRYPLSPHGNSAQLVCVVFGGWWGGGGSAAGGSQYFDIVSDRPDLLGNPFGMFVPASNWFTSSFDIFGVDFGSIWQCPIQPGYSGLYPYGWSKNAVSRLGKS